MSVVNQSHTIRVEPLRYFRQKPIVFRDYRTVVFQSNTMHGVESMANYEERCV